MDGQLNNWTTGQLADGCNCPSAKQQQQQEQQQQQQQEQQYRPKATAPTSKIPISNGAQQCQQQQTRFQKTAQSS
ncbi:hypothetical protein AWZ03_001091 [Drosophila navojoa]|uniref:Uncharacterized protein n=1 Tax=Drosophila navojoa TaxID=7232 RepID=A0A484BWW2_DRONA|nr:hypothetical protein AWZ03_001091 [Drosophila navojoa]